MHHYTVFFHDKPAQGVEADGMVFGDDVIKFYIVHGGQDKGIQWYDRRSVFSVKKGDSVVQQEDNEKAYTNMHTKGKPKHVSGVEGHEWIPFTLLPGNSLPEGVYRLYGSLDVSDMSCSDLAVCFGCMAVVKRSDMWEGGGTV